MKPVEQLLAECEKNRVVVELQEPGFGVDLRAVLVREGPRVKRVAELVIDGRKLTFTAGIKARAYRYLPLDLGKPGWANRASGFADMDLRRLWRQLEALSDYQTRFLVEGEELTLELRDVGSLFTPVALCIKVWRELGPMAEGDEAARSRTKRKPARKRPYWVPAKDAVAQLLERVTEATAHLQSVVARSGDAIEARVVGPYEDPARLVIGFATTRRVISRCDLRLVGDVPVGLPDVHFKRRGFWRKLFARLNTGMDELGVPALDATWLVDDPAAGRMFANAAPSAMLSLAELRGEVSVTGKRLVLRVDELDVERVVRSVSVGLILWERLTEVAREGSAPGED